MNKNNKNLENIKKTLPFYEDFYAQVMDVVFKLLFMRDRTSEKIEENREEIRPLLNIIMKNLDIGEDEAYFFHLELWLYVHGIATMIATNYLEWDIEFIDKVLTDAYQGLKNRYGERRTNNEWENL